MKYKLLIISIFVLTLPTSLFASYGNYGYDSQWNWSSVYNIYNFYYGQHYVPYYGSVRYPSYTQSSYYYSDYDANYMNRYRSVDQYYPTFMYPAYSPSYNTYYSYPYDINSGLWY